ncbi:phospholipidtranslocating P-type ATPase [Acanthamoeba castellanii str. Neff]|uniref:Phospholipid-transporting ATPase n=1 Tax=Acanthamoeba castellanii (strain ATCC 30010 / Neff) TaxID=1257118 RepID=L8HEP8_ACACF|nr:phospholipidtranslocating P-type ATPase [Acanthamoeba castellanii str. Neff]ELR23243.1 phospholipidtranslocating P-type ATPase [Acanthamoeba castellanii str. Neff]
MDSSFASSKGLGGASDRITPGKEKEKVVDEATTLEDEDEEVEEKETVEEELFPEDHVGYQEPRVVAINRPDLNMHYKFKNNYVSTTKYNFWNFIPKNLFEQFRRVANVYFLIIAIVTLTPTSPVKPVIVLGATAIKEAVEDWKRYQSDRRVNSRLCEVLRRKEDGGTDKWEYVEWADVVVGDLVRVKNWQPFPSDLLLISSSSADGQCYIETSNLDGETNLKVRQAVKETTGLTLMKDLACDAPNEDLYKFDGSLTLELQESHALQVALDTNQVLLRGSVLRNTEWIIGVVLYTGHQTKYMLSTTDPPSKQSRLEKLMNRLIIIVLLAELGIVVASAILGAIWEQANGKDMWFLELKRNLFVQIFENMFTFLVLYSPMVPISLYVTLEFVRVFQAGFIESDIAMYHEETNTPALARTSNLNEELGQIDYVFSDKTGTLTCNQMVFRVCSIGGTIYGEIPDLSAPSPSSSSSLSSSSSGVKALAPKKSRAELVVSHDAAVHSDGEEELELDDLSHREGGLGAGGGALTNGTGSVEAAGGSASTPDIEFDDPTIFEHIDDEAHPNSHMTREFFTVLAVCHSVMPELITKTNPAEEQARLKKLRQKARKQKKGLYLRPKNYNKLVESESSGTESDTEGEKNSEEEAAEEASAAEGAAQGPKEVRYQAASPDENALVAAAKYFGFYFHTRAHNTVTVNVMGQDLDFEVLNVMEFTSNRKRMSVVVRTPDGQFKLFTKGADNVVYERLRKGDPSAQVTEKHLHQFACAGLRTLCIAERVLDPVQYRAWNARFQKASLSFNGRKTKLDLLAEEIEVDLELLGATGIEDKLQDGVPDTIESLLEAGIKVWVLTGDKRETAINVGKACNLLKSNMITLVISSDTKIATKQRLEYLLGLIAANRWTQLAKEHERDDQMVPSTDEGATSKDAAAVWTKGQPKPSIALVIEGRTLVYALEYDLKFALLSLAQQCHTVVCCRTTPMQKTLMVKLVKDSETPETLTPKEKIQLELRKTAGYLTNRKKVTTLAVGDGANDVPMIQAAHVGIGISGREGMQAVLASDYAIAQFRFLKRLLFVHGRYSYKRMALLVLYFFYKNMLIALINFWWSFFTGFSGQTVWDSYLGIGFNLIFTCLPVVVCAVMDMDVPIKALDRYPRLYRDGQLNISLHTGIFMRWMFMAVLSSFLITTISIAVFNAASVYGLVLGLWDVNTVIYTGTIHHVVMWSSIISWFVVASIYCSKVALYLAPDMFWVIFNLFSVPTFWFVMPILCLVCLLPDIVWDFVMRTYFPSNYQVVQEIYRAEEEERKKRLAAPQLTLEETA